MNLVNKHPASSARRAFTLIELLVVISILAIVLAILLPVLSAGRHAAHDLKCKANLRTVAADFVLFADSSGGGHGDGAGLGETRFLLEDFQESIYKIEEFWTSTDVEREPVDGPSLAMACPSSGGLRLERRAGIPCSSGAVGPAANISVGFNMRLHKRTRIIDGTPYLRSAILGPRVLAYSDVPLLFDLDGRAAQEADTIPYYAAPAILDDKSADGYESGSHWFPSMRHRGKMNVAFIGGHVLSSTDPVAEPWSRWEFEPEE
ncbi:MAG TPA: type II secretion system protein [Phycisphaerae bacterium]|nr:type II secretion system protein [Phycisphaerae bacterium]